MADCCIKMYIKQYLPVPSKVTLLHSLGFCTTSHKGWLLQKIVQLHGVTSIYFTHVNNRRGSLVFHTIVLYCLLCFNEDLSKPGPTIDTTILDCLKVQCYLKK